MAFGKAVEKMYTFFGFNFRQIEFNIKHLLCQLNGIMFIMKLDFSNMKLDKCPDATDFFLIFWNETPTFSS